MNILVEVLQLTDFSITVIAVMTVQFDLRFFAFRFDFGSIFADHPSKLGPFLVAMVPKILQLATWFVKRPP